jgi:hypothetical protein
MQETIHATPLKLGPYFTKGIRFRETAKAVLRAQPESVLVIGCQYGYLESVLPDEIRTLSIDIVPASIEMAKAVNAGKPRRLGKTQHSKLIPKPSAASSRLSASLLPAMRFAALWERARRFGYSPARRYRMEPIAFSFRRMPLHAPASLEQLRSPDRASTSDPWDWISRRARLFCKPAG